MSEVPPVSVPSTTGSATSAAPLQGRKRALLLLLLGCLSAFGPLSLDMYLPSLPTLTHDLGASPSAAQLTLSACLLGLALGQVIMGPLSDALGRRWLLLCGMATYALASLLCIFAPNIAFLVFLRLLQGLAGATGIVIARAVVRDLYSGVEAARVFSWQALTNGIAPVVAPVLGGFLLRFTSWRSVFVVLTLVGVLLCWWVARGLEETLPADRRQRGGLRTMLGAFRLLLRDRAFVGYAFSSGLAGVALFAYIAGSPFVMQNIYHLSPQAFSLVFGINALGIIIASQVNGRLVGRFSLIKVLFMGLSLMTVGGIAVVLVVLTPLGLVGLLPALFVTIASIGMVFPSATALGMTRYPHAAGSASALLGVLQFSLGALVIPLVGAAGTGTALPMALLVDMGASLALLVLLLLVRQEDRSASQVHHQLP